MGKKQLFQEPQIVAAIISVIGTLFGTLLISLLLGFLKGEIGLGPAVAVITFLFVLSIWVLLALRWGIRLAGAAAAVMVVVGSAIFLLVVFAQAYLGISPPPATPIAVVSITPTPTVTPPAATRITTPLGATATPVGPTPTPPRAPAPGTGNVAGRIFWNRQPIAGAEVKLCQEFKTILGRCEGAQYSQTTDDEGRYFFADVPVGEYVVLDRIPGEEKWTFQARLTTPIKDAVEEGQTLTVDLSCIRSDLELLSPKDEEEVATTTPVLQWEAYPGADYYQIAFQYETLGVFLLNTGDRKLKEPQLDVAKELPASLRPGKYTWWVEAYNEYHDLIAKSEYHANFIVAGEPPLFALLSPADNAEVKGSGLTLTWEAWPGAAYYKVYAHRTEPDYKLVIDFVHVSGTSYTVEETLKTGKYYWTVTAYDANDQIVAKNRGDYSFVVTE